MLNRIFLRLLASIIFFGWACIATSTTFADKYVANEIYCETTDIASPEDLKHLQLYANNYSKDKAYYQAILASLYRRGEVVQTDLNKAKELLKQAVESDQSGLAFYELAILYQSGNKVEENKTAEEEYFKKALPLLIKTANQNDPRAQYRLAVMYEYGYGGVTKDQKESESLDELAAKNGHWLAEMRHGSNFKDKGDFYAAADWLCRSAKKGYTHGMRTLADLFAKESKNIAERNDTNDAEIIKQADELLAAARIWYKRSALHNPNPANWINLGQMLENGRVFISDYKKAAEWYRKASQANDMEGKYRLAMLIWFELEDEPNRRNKAEKLFKEVAKNGHEGAENMLEFIRDIK